MARNVLNNCEMKSEPRLDRKPRAELPDPQNVSVMVDQPFNVNEVVLNNKDMSTSMIRRKFGISYGVINRILADESASDSV